MKIANNLVHVRLTRFGLKFESAHLLNFGHAFVGY